MISFVKFFESYGNTITIPYIVGDQYTSGVHAFHEDEQEIPAEDPIKYIRPKFLYGDVLENHKSEIIQVVYKRYEWGSYHERQLYCQAHLQFSSTPGIEELEQEKNGFDFVMDLDHGYGSDRTITKTAPFTTFEDVLDNWWEMVRSSEIKTPTGSSGDYWNKKILNTQMGYKQDYDGD